MPSMYAGMVMAAAVEDAALMAAMTAADTAATAAETAATAAEEAAVKVAELVGADSGQATDADAAAVAARSAAVVARAASDAADAADESSVAIGHQTTAETEQGEAETQLAVATELARESQVAHDTSALQNEVRDIADGRADAKMYSEMAEAHYDSAVAKQALARAQATAARAAANRAESARRDDDTAGTHATAAEAAADAADAAVVLALAAKNAAAEAYMMAMADDVTGAAAKAAAAEARAQNVIATAQDDVADMNYMAAKAAAEDAIAAAKVYVEDTDILVLANASPALVNTAINLEATDEDGAQSPNAAGAAATAMVTWDYHGALGVDGMIGGDLTNADSKPGEGRVLITLNVGGNTVTQMYDLPTTAGKDESNFVQGIGVGDFAEYHIGSGDASPKTRALVFTDRVQNTGPIPSTTVVFSNLTPVASRLSVWIGVGMAMYDHDGDGAATVASGTPPIEVTVSCPSLANVVTTCTASEIENSGYVSSISGFRISTADTGVTIDAVAERVNDTYLSFGVWLTETTSGNPDHTFGAFADGGSQVAAQGIPAGMKGTATYRGSAAGLHSKPKATEFFSAAATLTANFDGKVLDEEGLATAADVAGGTITGRIHNIVSGGVAMSESIYLDVATDTPSNANITVAGAISGRARMGAGSTDAVTGNVLYPYNGTWSGQFYNAVADDPTTAAVDESVTIPPGSVAGTFGVAHIDKMGTPTDMSDDETSSFVGGYGAHKQ